MNLTCIVDEFSLVSYGGPGTGATEITRQFNAKGYNILVTLQKTVDAGFYRLAKLSIGSRNLLWDKIFNNP